MSKGYATFSELQRLNRWLFLPILIPVILLFIIRCVGQLGLGKPWGNNPLPDIWLIIITMVMLLLSANTLWMYLKTFIDRDGIHIRMWMCPFYVKTKSFYWEDIAKAYIRKYKPVVEYGGWGIQDGNDGLNLLGNTRFSVGKIKFLQKETNNMAYNMSGNIGLQLVLKNDKKVLIGTQKQDELLEVVKQLWKPGNKTDVNYV